MKNKIYLLGLTLLVAVLFSSCADVSPHVQDCITSDPYGFFGGLWHGSITGFSFIGSLIYDDIAIYAYDNVGGWYDFGFVLGIGGFIKLIGLLVEGLLNLLFD